MPGSLSPCASSWPTWPLWAFASPLPPSPRCWPTTCQDRDPLWWMADPDALLYLVRRPRQLPANHRGLRPVRGHLSTSAFCHVYSGVLWPRGAGILDHSLQKCPDPHTMLQTCLSFCAHNQVPHFFCDLSPLLQLACSDTFLNNMMVYAVGALPIITALWPPWSPTRTSLLLCWGSHPREARGRPSPPVALISVVSHWGLCQPPANAEPFHLQPKQQGHEGCPGGPHQQEASFYSATTAWDAWGTQYSAHLNWTSLHSSTFRYFFHKILETVTT